MRTIDVTISPTVTSRIKGLDGLRAIAVILVVAAHAHLPWLHGGGVGVDIFFCISGFLITYLLIAEVSSFGRISLKKFWLRRLLRLMPALLLLVFVIDTVAVALQLMGRGQSFVKMLDATPSVLLYYSNWMIVGTDSPYLGWFGPLWSLSVEEQFYILWPLLVILAVRTQKFLLVAGTIAAGGSIVAAVARFFTFDGSNIYRTFGTDFRVDMLLTGVLLAIALHTEKALVTRLSGYLFVPGLIYLACVAVLVPEFGRPGSELANRAYYTYGLPLVSLSSVSIIAFLATHSKNWLTAALSWRPLAYVGKISYGVYLWHYPITMMVGYIPRLNQLLIFLISLGATCLVAGISFRYLEAPLSQRYRQRLKPGTLVDVHG